MALHEFGRMLMALALVLGLLWLLARFAKGRQGSRPVRTRRTAVPDGRIDLVSRRSLGRHSSVAVIRVGDRTIVIGQTQQQITVLTELRDEVEVPDPVPVAAVDDGDEVIDLLGDEALMPWLASEHGAPAPKAWDAFVDGLREMTVRR